MLQKMGKFPKMFLYSYNVYIGIYADCVNFFSNMTKVIVLNEITSYICIVNGWRYGVGLPCRLFQPTTAVNGKLHHTACCVSGAVKLAKQLIK